MHSIQKQLLLCNIFLPLSLSPLFTTKNSHQALVRIKAHCTDHCINHTGIQLLPQRAYNLNLHEQNAFASIKYLFLSCNVTSGGLKLLAVQTLDWDYIASRQLIGKLNEPIRNLKRAFCDEKFFSLLQSSALSGINSCTSQQRLHSCFLTQRKTK